MEEFNNLAKTYENNRGDIHNISLGKGQGEKALKVIQEG